MPRAISPGRHTESPLERCRHVLHVLEAAFLRDVRQLVIGRPQQFLNAAIP